MHNLAVHWHEGLFLRPQHLQAWDRHWHEVTTASERWQSPYSYGIAQVSINHDALAAGFFQLDVLRAKMLDGTLVELNQGESSQRIDLRPALDALGEQEASTIPLRGAPGVDVYLAIPRLQLGNSNVSDSAGDRIARFESLQQEVPDDSDGNSVEPILFRKINARLMLSTEDAAGFETLKIARVIRQSRGGALAVIDARYIPPLLDCAAWPVLKQYILRPIHDLITTKASLLARIIKDQSGDQSGGGLRDVQQWIALQALNEASGVMAVLTQSRGIHPLQAYYEVSRIAGSLDILSPELTALPIAPYDHESIGPLFAALRARIEQRLRNAGAIPYQQKPFTGVYFGGETSGPKGLRLSLPSDWLQSNQHVVLGIHRGTLTSNEIDELLSPGQLDWKLGSEQEVNTLFTKRLGGVDLAPARSIPKFLPSPTEWSYFEFDRSSPAWDDVLNSQTLALRFRDTLLDSAQRWDGCKSVRLNVNGRFVQVQFACFSYQRSDA